MWIWIGFLHQINIQCYFFRGSLREPFFKVTSVCEYKILNILIKGPLNTIFFCIRAISQVRICSDIYYVNVWHLNIFGYSFGKLFCIGMNLDICLYLLFDICPSLSTGAILDKSDTVAHPASKFFSVRRDPQKGFFLF